MKNKYFLIFIAFLIVFSPLSVEAVEGTNNQYNNQYQDPWLEDNQTDTYNEGQYGESNNTYQDPNQNTSPNNETWNDGTPTEGYYDANGNWVEPNQNNNNYNDNSGAYDGSTTAGYYDANGVWIEGNQQQNQEQTETTEEVDPSYEEEYQEPVETYEEPYIEETEPVVEETEEEQGISIQALEGEGYTVSGKIVDEDEVGLEGLTVVLSDGEESVESQSDRNGQFIFEDVSSGTYVLSMKEHENYEAVTEPIDVEVGNRDKLGYSIAVQSLETEEETEEEVEEVPEEENEDTPVEEAETDEKASDSTNERMSGVEVTLISVGVLLLLSTIGILLYRRFVK